MYECATDFYAASVPLCIWEGVQKASHQHLSLDEHSACWLVAGFDFKENSRKRQLSLVTSCFSPVYLILTKQNKTKHLVSISGSSQPQCVSYYLEKTHSWQHDKVKDKWVGGCGKVVLVIGVRVSYRNWIPWPGLLASKPLILLLAFISSTIGCSLQASILKDTARFSLGGGGEWCWPYRC